MLEAVPRAQSARVAIGPTQCWLLTIVVEQADCQKDPNVPIQLPIGLPIQVPIQVTIQL